MKNISFIAAICITKTLIAQPGNFDYFGMTPPGNTPEVFAPGILSLEGRREKDLAISPDGDEVFFMSGDHFPGNIIMHMEKSGDTWSEADTAFFSKDCNATRPYFSPDGQYLYFSSNRGKSNSYDFSIWRIKKEADSWSAPESVIDMGGGSIIELDPKITVNALYFIVEGNPNTFMDIYKAEIIDDEFSDPVKVDNPISIQDFEDGLYVDKTGEYMIFLTGRSGECDSYIAYRKDDGTWTNPKDIGSVLGCNTIWVSPDEEYFFIYDIDYDIYWMSAGNLIDSLQHTNFAPYIKTPVEDQHVITGIPFSIQIADSVFYDDDGYNTLTVSATLHNGDPLPGWLDFDPVSLLFSGTAPLAETLNLKLTATDTAGAAVSESFRIIVTDVSGIATHENTGLVIAPNPASGIVAISFKDNPFEEAEVEIIDQSGKRVLSWLTEGRSGKVVDMGPYPKGIYTVRVITGDIVLNRKLCLE